MKHIHDPFDDILSLPVIERGAWLATATGGMWSIHHPSPEDVSIRDIAAGLSRACRYNGQIREDCDFLSVSEHSVLMTKWAIDNKVARTAEDALAILLHDASEAFFGDMVTPLKALLPEFKKIENHAQSVIMKGFGLSADRIKLTKSQIKAIDNRIRLDEREHAIMDPALSEGRRIMWDEVPELTALSIDIEGLNPREARIQFLETFVNCVEALPIRNPENINLLEMHKQDALANLETINAKMKKSYSETISM
jgi:5'-deoxynucleotidase YfbR-like HD superfamily hydrolase